MYYRIKHSNLLSIYRKKINRTIKCLAFLLVLYYPAINAILIEIATKLDLDCKFYNYSITTYFCLLLINISAIWICIRGIHFSGLQKLLAIFIIGFVYLSIQHDSEWILKDFLYLLFIILPSTIISIDYIKSQTDNAKFFNRFNVILLGVICSFLIILSPSSIELRASLPHLNANTYAAFGAYLFLAGVVYPTSRPGSYLIILICISLALGVLSYANSVGITLILLISLIFSLFSGLSTNRKKIILVSIMLLLGVFNLSRFNEQKISLLDRAETLIKNDSSTLYDRILVYQYTLQNFWDHFFIGKYYYFPDIHTAHNIFIEIFLITGFFGLSFFCSLVIVSSYKWLLALKSGNEAIIFIALIYIFSLFEALFRGRLVYSVLFVALISVSLNSSFVKFICKKKRNPNVSN